MGTITGVEFRLGWEENEQKEFLKAIRQPLMVQTPLQVGAAGKPLQMGLTGTVYLPQWEMQTATQLPVEHTSFAVRTLEPYPHDTLHLVSVSVPQVVIENLFQRVQGQATFMQQIKEKVRAIPERLAANALRQVPQSATNARSPGRMRCS